MKLKPTGDKYLVEVLEKETKTAGGIIINQRTGGQQLVACEAVVVSRGQGLKDMHGEEMEMYAEVGTKVLIDKKSGVDVPADYHGEPGKKYKFINNSNIIAVLGDV